MRDRDSVSKPTIDLYRVDRPTERASCIAHLLLPQLDKETSGQGLLLAYQDIVLETTPLGDPAVENPFLSSPRHGLLLLTYPCDVDYEEPPVRLANIVYAVILRTSGIFRIASEISSERFISPEKNIPVYMWHQWAQNEVAVLGSDNDELIDGPYSVGRAHGSRIIFNDFGWDIENEFNRHVATIYRQSDDAEETPLGRPAPISAGGDCNLKLELDSNPAVKRLKINMKVISAFSASGEHYLDQNHILALEPDPHEPQNVVPGHGNGTGPNRKLVKVWTMG
ncbi:hypothetical protein SISSUDRAFT_1063299 [Sistotremastrum suecicum HHB10207 ss-3]|uniref:Uncharacterized protein n=1 Tax=Sistotremastrum suecicum HHB10207 ss-3 TaxID=1314776 RepID=A0A166BXY6_9AGAM|nr:hypothetical protein SISSUDRAFT_1063299 [Sistotremastrum suecicum HHB10207 ss-3]